MASVSTLKSAKTIALIAAMAALLEGGKLALVAIPNVEIVTLLCALFGYVFGLCGLISVAVFLCAEALIWGFGTWLISYVIHWNFVCLVFLLLNKANVKNRFVLSATAVLLCASFSVLTSLVDVGLFSGQWTDFWSRFAIYYVRGIWFYVTQAVCNAVVFVVIFPIAQKNLLRLKDKYYAVDTSR